MPEKVSIVVPLYNRADLVGETIQSVLDQTSAHWELIIVDDGSTDDSAGVVKSYAAEDERIKYYKRHRDPKGAPTCRNIGVEKSTGEYVIFLDSDDLLAPWCIQERLKRMREYPQVDFLVFNGMSFYKQPLDNRFLWNCEKPESDLVRFCHNDSPWQTSGPIWKKESLFAHSLKWDEMAEDWQDWEFHIQALIRGLPYRKFLSCPDYFIRRGYSSGHISSYEYSIERLIGRIKLFGSVRRQFEQLLPDDLQLVQAGVVRIIYEYFNGLIFKKMDYGRFWKEVSDNKLISGREYLFGRLYGALLSFGLQVKVPGLVRAVHGMGKKLKGNGGDIQNTMFQTVIDEPTANIMAKKLNR